jgi:hypothetical protein
MDKSIYDNTTTSSLSISSKKICCEDVVKKLFELGIVCSVTPNTTVCCNLEKCWVENGCNIILNGIKPTKMEKSVWEPLKKSYDLNCAYLNIHGYYKGCISNYIKPSKCNWKEKKG